MSTKCPTCGYDVVAGYPCSQCAPSRPDMTGSKGPVATDLPAQAGAIAAGVGVLLLVFGFVRLSSLESQFMRAVGRSDGLATFLLLIGVLIFGFGAWVFATASKGAPTSGTAVEDRLRQLDNLRAKGLITEEQYEQRKKEIVASI